MKKINNVVIPTLTKTLYLIQLDLVNSKSHGERKMLRINGGPNCRGQTVL